MAMKMNEKIAKRIVNQINNAVLVNLTLNDLDLFYVGQAGAGMNHESCANCLNRKLGICSAYYPPENNLAIYTADLKAESLQRLHDIIPVNLDFDTDCMEYEKAEIVKENQYYQVIVSLENINCKCKIRIKIVLTELCYFTLAKAKNVKPLCNHTLSYLQPSGGI